MGHHADMDAVDSLVFDDVVVVLFEYDAEVLQTGVLVVAVRS